MDGEKVTLFREEPLTITVPVYHAKATFTDKDDKTYTFHTKTVEGNSIILAKYDPTTTAEERTHFNELHISHEDEQGNINHYNEKVPLTPRVTIEESNETTIVSLKTCKDFTITETTQETFTHTGWSACTDMPREIAEAYVDHFDNEHTYIYD